MPGSRRDMRSVIAKLSHELVQLYDGGCALTDPLLVQRSQTLDRFIVEWCRQQSPGVVSLEESVS